MTQQPAAVKTDNRHQHRPRAATAVIFSLRRLALMWVMNTLDEDVSIFSDSYS